MLLFIIIWVVCGIAGYNMGKDRSVGEGGGLALGLLLGIIGIIILACLPKKNATKELYEKYQQESMAKAMQASQQASSQQAIEPSVDVVAELKKWHELKEAGVITQEEFEERKRKLI